MSLITKVKASALLTAAVLLAGGIAAGAYMAAADSPAASMPASAPVVTGDKVNKEFSVDLGGGVILEMVWIPPGTFTMGSPDSEKVRDSDQKDPAKAAQHPSETQHQVTLTKGFWMGKHEVTQEQWERVMGSNPSKFKGPKNPVDSVSWNDAQEFIKKLNAKAGEQSASAPAGAGGFRLPTEAEWEYACRAGSKTRFCYGDDDNKLADYAWYDRNSGGKTHPVGQKKANAWGLCDMHGNVKEFVSDWYAPYSSDSVTDPRGSVEKSEWGHPDRGGFYDTGPERCTSAYRRKHGPTFKYPNLGFRLVKTANSP